MKPQPPRLLTHFFRWFCRQELVDAVEGDLLELYYRRLAKYGRTRANWLYLWNVLTFFQPFALRRKRHPLNLLYPFDMLRNYLKMTYRTLRASKTFTFINIFGLALGMAAFMLITAFVTQEMSYDDFHTKKDRIYRLQYQYSARDEERVVSRVAFPVKQRLMENYPEVERIVRFYQNRIDRTTLSFGDQMYTEDNVLFADPELLEVFDFELERGDPKTVLSQMNSIVLTKKAAIKYFGDEDPLGKSMKYKDQDALQVTGILQNVPTNSHLQFDMIVPVELQRQRWMRNQNNNGYDFEKDWKWSGAWTYVLLKEGASYGSFATHFQLDGIDGFGRLPDREIHYQYLAQPMSDVYFDKDVISQIGPTGNQVQVYALIAVAFLILVIATINFINLSTARSARRAKEVGLRKVMGAFRQQLIFQFVCESIVVCAVAALGGVLIVHAMIPVFSQFIGKTIAIPYGAHPEIVLYLIVGIVSVGFLAGLYPAFYLSKFLPSRTLKGNFERQGRKHMGLRMFLVTGQFIISNVLIVGVLVIQGQLSFIKNKDLGFDKDQTIVLTHGNKIDKSFSLLETELRKIPGIEHVGLGYVAGESGWGQTFRVNGEETPLAKRLGLKHVGYNFVDMYDLEVVEGRFFQRDSKMDSASAILLNEAAVQVFGWTPEEALGQKFSYSGGNDNRTIYRLQVIGVLKDANFESLYEPVRPSVFQLAQWGDVAIKYNVATRAELFDAIDETQKAWEAVTPRWPFEFRFLDDHIAEQYKKDELLGELIKYFGLLAITIACLGLLGLASFVVQKRTKEIGVRKVMGATVRGILLLIGRNFLLLVVGSYLLSIPIAHWLAGQWLQDFAFRIELSWTFFVMAGLISFVISFVAVSSQSLRAALLNPVDALKYE
ncbi:MAG: ABC transporter permease [Bacteroidota bacterium]